jgi:molybdopterin converting factor small subunit
LATIRIPPILRPEAEGQRQIEAGGATVREVLESLVARYPSLRERILAGGELPQFLNVFIDGSDVRLLAGLDTPVSDASTVILLPAVAGGAARSDAEAEPLARRDDLGAVDARG